MKAKKVAVFLLAGALLIGNSNAVFAAESGTVVEGDSNSSDGSEDGDSGLEGGGSGSEGGGSGLEGGGSGLEGGSGTEGGSDTEGSGSGSEGGGTGSEGGGIGSEGGGTGSEGGGIGSEGGGSGSEGGGSGSEVGSGSESGGSDGESGVVKIKAPVFYAAPRATGDGTEDGTGDDTGTTDGYKDIPIESDTADGETLTKFEVDNTILGGDLIVSIPAEMTLEYDATSETMTKADYVSASGRCGANQKLEIRTATSITYKDDKKAEITVPGTVAFGVAEDDKQLENWTAVELLTGVKTPDSIVKKDISATVQKSDIDYIGSYSSVIQYNITVVTTDTATEEP